MGAGRDHRAPRRVACRLLRAERDAASALTAPRTEITGGTGFVGRHLAERLSPEASVIISRRTGVDTSDVDALTAAFEGCEVVAHCAGINREIGDQTYQRIAERRRRDYERQGNEEILLQALEHKVTTVRKIAAA